MRVKCNRTFSDVWPACALQEQRRHHRRYHPREICTLRTLLAVITRQDPLLLTESCSIKWSIYRPYPLTCPRVRIQLPSLSLSSSINSCSFSFRVGWSGETAHRYSRDTFTFDGGHDIEREHCKWPVSPLSDHWLHLWSSSCRIYSIWSPSGRAFLRRTSVMVKQLSLFHPLNKPRVLRAWCSLLALRITPLM